MVRRHFSLDTICQLKISWMQDGQIIFLKNFMSNRDRMSCFFERSNSTVIQVVGYYFFDIRVDISDR